MKIGSLFSGIGGLELGLERAGVGHVAWQVEKDHFCREVLAKHWPDAARYEDVRTVGKANLLPVDLICGGFPCQDISNAGKRAGITGERSGLWAEYLRIIGELRPTLVLVENVAALRTRGLLTVLRGLASLGYDAEWHTTTAVWLGAPHVRPRLFVVAADPNRVQLRSEQGGLAGAFRAAFAPVPGDALAARDASNADSLRRLEQARRVANIRGWSRLIGWELADVAGVDDGVPIRVGPARKAYGNAVVPQAAEVIGRYVMECAGMRGAA